MPTPLLLTISGKDSPGITSEFTQILSKYSIVLMDLAQTVIYQLLSLSFLIQLDELPVEETSNPFFLELRAKASELNLKIEVQSFGSDLDQDGQPIRLSRSTWSRYAVTLIADHVSANALHRVSSVLARWNVNIDVIRRLSELEFSCVEMIVTSSDSISLHDLRKELLTIAKDQNVDIAFQTDDLYRRTKRLVVMDIDSTLIQSEVIDELARENGVYPEVAAITHTAMLGEMDFDESLRRRCALLKGLSVQSLNQVVKRIQLTPGASDLLYVLKRLGYKTAVISGGFTFVADRLKEKLSIDFAYANTLEIQNGKLTGKVVHPIVNAQRKADLLEVIAQKEQIDLNQVVAIGDGANDLLMLEKAGLGIAFNAKPIVTEQADLSYSQKDMRSILYLLGLSAREVSQVILSRS